MLLLEHSLFFIFLIKYSAHEIILPKRENILVFHPTTFDGLHDCHVSNYYNNIYKYFGRAAGNANVVDVKALRTAEVLLSRAEAYARLNKNTEALADLNTLRKQRYSDYVAGTETGADLLTAILLQRRLELAFEGSRFFDLKRLGLGVTRSSFGDKSDGTGINNVTKALPAGDIHFQLPFPQSEINANPNIVQNPGY